MKRLNAVISAVVFLFLRAVLPIPTKAGWKIEASIKSQMIGLQKLLQH